MSQTGSGQAVGLKVEPGAQVLEERTEIMGTDISVLIADEAETSARRAVRTAFDEIQRIDNLMTDWRASPFEEINRQAGVAPVHVANEILFVVEEAIRLSNLTDGRFDISYASAGQLWDFKRSPPVVPGQESIRNALERVGFTRIEVRSNDQTVFLPEKGMRIGLGGIAKGYAIDCAVRAIRQLGVRHFAVNAGGDLTVRGTKGGQLWRIAIRHPRDPGRNIALLPISNGTVATSGDSERFFIADGIRYCHIIDPRTGYPARDCQGVTLIAKEAYLADALATAVFVMGPAEGMRFIETQKHLQGMIVDAEGQVHVSRGLQAGGKPGTRRL